MRSRNAIWDSPQALLFNLSHTHHLSPIYINQPRENQKTGHSWECCSFSPSLWLSKLNSVHKHKIIIQRRKRSSVERAATERNGSSQGWRFSAASCEGSASRRRFLPQQPPSVAWVFETFTSRLLYMPVLKRTYLSVCCLASYGWVCSV